MLLQILGKLLFIANCLLLVEICDATKIVDIDFKNEQFYQHKTAMFYDYLDNIRDVIIRRGMMFEFRVDLDSAFNGHLVDVIFTFQTLKDKMVILLPSNNQRNWKINENGAQQSVHIKVIIPGHAPVGVWNLALILKDRTGRIQHKVSVTNRIVILFNPWVSSDYVFMNDERMIKEYVLNEKGMLFKWKSPDGAKPWFFNQFKQGILDAVLFILNRAEITAEERGDPVRVSKEMKFLINHNPKVRRGGVLVGKWGPPYDTWQGKKATPPIDWTGSAQILESYYRSGGLPVAYAQCWVYSAVLTTIFRALGIPARPITAFDSAIDHDTDLTVDQYYNNRGFYDKHRSDSMWNFHVWNEVWMSRNQDLRNNDLYGNWQELDGTPQRIRDGFLQNGPAPTNAVRLSQIDKYYDSDVIYSEMNADYVVWKGDKIFKIKTDNVGTSVLTKAIGSNLGEEIIYLYKPKEGTLEERQSYRKAAAVLGIKPPSLYKQQQRSIQQKIKVDIPAVKKAKIGSKVKIVVHVKNLSTKQQKISLGLKLTSVFYDGVDDETIIDKTLNNIVIAPHSKKGFDFILNQNEYIGKMEDYYLIRIEAVATDQEGYFDHAEQTLSFSTPALRITNPQKAKVNEEFVIQAEFDNPLDIPLRKCYFIYEGTRVERQVITLNDVRVGGKVSIRLRIKTKFPRLETIVISFVSSSLNDVQGSVDIEITDDKPKKTLYPHFTYVTENIK